MKKTDYSFAVLITCTACLIGFNKGRRSGNKINSTCGRADDDEDEDEDGDDDDDVTLTLPVTTLLSSSSMFGVNCCQLSSRSMRPRRHIVEERR